MNAVKKKIMSLENHHDLKNGHTVDPELILLVCNCVENALKRKAGIDKKRLVIEILTSVFGTLTPQEISHIKNQCQYNYDNRLIETIHILYKTGSILYHYIKSKF